jgi:hypothetical protein
MAILFFISHFKIMHSCCASETLTDTVDLASPRNQISDPEAILRFVVALSGTGPLQPAPILGYQDEPFTNIARFKVKLYSLFIIVLDNCIQQKKKTTTMTTDC